MKQSEQSKTVFTQVNNGSLKPEMPFIARQVATERRVVDPSSSLRSERYPIPVYSEYRMRISE